MCYLCPLPLTGKVPEELQKRVLEEAESAMPLFHVYTDGQEKRIGQGFEIQRGVTYQEGSNEFTWQERLLVVQSDGHAKKQLQTLDKKLQAVIPKLEALQGKSFTDMEKLENKVYALLEKHQLVEVFQLRFFEIQETVKRHAKRGKPTTKSKKVTYTTYRPRFEFQLDEDQWRQKQKLCGWRLFVINASSEQTSLNSI